MNKPINRALLNLRLAPARRMMGVVLPVVLVVLTVLTGLVVTQIRRGAVDERLAANTRESVQLDSAVQTVLRWCEARITLFPHPTQTAQVTAPSTPVYPAWGPASANWTTTANSLDFSGGANLLPGLNASPTCVIENATCELAPPISPTGQVLTSICAGGGELDPRWRKFRVTAMVSTPAPDMTGGNRFTFAQSELRIFIE